MLQERWAPSWGLRMLAGIQAICYLSLGCVLMWFFFPHVLLVPAATVVAAECLAVLVLPFRVVLDPGRGEVAITVAFWTRHVPLTDVVRVEESGRLRAEIVTAGGWSFGIGPFAKRRWLAAWLRTGFEGMEAAVTQAAEVARAGAPARRGPGSPRRCRDGRPQAGPGSLSRAGSGTWAGSGTGSGRTA